MSKVKAIVVNGWESFREDPGNYVVNGFIATIWGILGLWAAVIVGSVTYVATARVFEIARNLIASVG